MRSDWRDGGRTRAVEIAPLGGRRWRVTVDGVALELSVEPLGDGRLRVTGPDGAVTSAVVGAAGDRHFVRLGRMDFVLEKLARAAAGRSRGHASRSSGHGGLESPMPGVVTKVMVAPGDRVKKGQALVAIEAMKMEHLIRAPRDGRVRAVSAKTGAMVNGGVELVELEEAPG
jgi:3-methylcrotonyl-CoA carboxylase alpha subunit